MRLQAAWQLALAETRRSWGRLSFCVFSVALGVFALTAVRSVTSSVNESLAGQARNTMGADLALSSRQPLDETTAPALTQQLLARGARSANKTRFYSMLSRPEGSADKATTQLVRVQAIGDGFPFYGTIKTSPPDLFGHLSQEPQVIVDPQIMRQLRLKVGERVRLGKLTAKVAGHFISQPGSPAAEFSLAPSLYMHERYLAETDLLKTGSRIDYERLFALPQGMSAEAWEKQHQGESASDSDSDDHGVRIKTSKESTSNVQRFLDRLGGFLTMVGLITLLLGALGIGSALRAFMRDKLDHAAILRCIGVTPRGLFLIYGLLALLIAGSGSVLGAALGAFMPLALGQTLQALGQGFLPEGLALRPHLGAALSGAAAGLLSTFAFTLIPLWRTAQVAPLRVLRRDVEVEKGSKATRHTIIATLAAVLSICLLMLMILDGDSWRTGAVFAAAVSFSAFLLWLLAILMMRTSRWLATRLASYPIRQGVANLHRPGNQTTSVVVAIGLGVLLISAMLIIQASLQQAIAVDQRRELPNLFVIDIQTDQAGEVADIAKKAGAADLEMHPMITARIRAVNGRRVTEKAQDRGQNGEGQGRTWEDRMRTREYSVSYRAHTVDSETVTEGRFWSGSPKRQEVSLDQRLSEILEIKLGDTLTLDIQGLPFESVVTSFREIHWQAVRPNSMILLSPGEISDAPKIYVAALRIGEESRFDLQSQLVQRFPNLTVVDVTQAAKTVQLIVTRVGAVFRGLGSLAIFAGALILAGAVTSGRHARLRESMLLKVLGAKRAALRKILVTEHLALALFGASAGVFLAEVLSRNLLPHLFDVRVHVPYGAISALVAATILLNTALGAFISRHVSRRPPLEILQEE